ncbi:MAG: helix-turn-helix transcriptional regulator [Desulfuromonadaceae bacterium]|nr:helix-turn-helix transcriptional regulator [Desulfuromonadaceae bacterium]
MARTRPYSKYTLEAVKLLGKQIQLGRKQRRWSENELAQRIGIARATLQRIEKGDMACAIGLVFEAATLVGIKLFNADGEVLRRQVVEAEERIALLPRHIHPVGEVVDDEF